MQYLFYFLKALYILSLLHFAPLLYALPLIYLSYYIFHSILVPKFLKVQPITLIDAFMLYDTPLNRTHWGSFTFYDRIDYTKLYEIRLNLIKQFPRLRSKVIHFFGSAYFSEIPLATAEKAIQKVSGIHTKRDLELFCDKVFHEPFPKEGPLWKLFIIDDYSPTQSLQISILHHAIYDGLAGVFLTWMYGEEDATLLPNFRPISLLEKIYLYAALIYTLPAATIKIMLKKEERNPINNGKPLTGVKKMAFYDDISFEIIKENYKKSGSTLNDYFIGVLSKSLKDYFQVKDPNKVYHTVNLGFPINLRSNYPKKHNEVVLENNITAADLTIPLIDDVGSETRNITRIIKKMKTSGEYFANSIFLKMGVLLLPGDLMCKVNNFITSKTSVCLSNVPFYRKPLYLKENGVLLQNEIGFLNNNSDIGVALAVLTYGEKVSISVVADVARLENPEELALIFRNNLMKG